MTAYRLVVEKGRSKGTFLRLKQNGMWVAGREQSNQLRISDPQSSRKHFQVEGKLGTYQLKDLGSSNGTFVNGERVETHSLRPGDKVSIGDTLIYFLEETDEQGGERRGPLTGREVAGYRLGRVLGRGGMGTVYEAVQVSLERSVAFKVLAPEYAEDQEFIQRFIAEARAAGRLNHANIVAVFDVGSVDGLYFYSMEYMTGGSVEDLVRREGPLPVERTIPILFDAARGLEYAERQGLVHRDIKPDNLMIGADEVVKICDLGLAIFSAQQHDVSGSPHYIAPEQALGEDIDHRADLYALGVSWYQMLCGETPFNGRTAQEIARKHVDEEPPSLLEKVPDTPPEVASLLARLMAKDREVRLPSARQLQADLAVLARRFPVRETVLLRIDAVAPEDPPSDEVMPPEPVEPEPEAGGRAAWIGLGVLAALLLVAAFLITRGALEGQAHRLASGRARVDAVRALVASGELARAVEQGRTLAADLTEQGLDELAIEATELSAQAQVQQEEVDRRRRAVDARRRLDEVRARFATHTGPPAPDSAARAELEALERVLGEVIQAARDTAVAVDAQRVRDEVSSRRRSIADLIAGRERAAREAREALTRTGRGIEGLLNDDRADKFQQALARAQEYIASHGEVEPKGGPQLIATIRARAARAVEEAILAALTHAGRGRWAEARTELERLGPSVGFEDLDQRVREAFADLDRTRRDQQREQEAYLEQADRERALTAIRDVADAVADRRYVDAAGGLETLPLRLKTERWRELVQARIARLRGAGLALKRLFEHVNSDARPRVELELEIVTGKGLQRCRAINVDLLRTFTFELNAQIQTTVRLGELEPPALLEMFEALTLDPAARLDLGCLAYELRQDGAAVALVSQAVSLDRALADRARALEVLAASEAR